MWRDNIDVQICSYSKHHIDFQVQSTQDKIWRGIGIYGHPEKNRKKHTWTPMKRLTGMSTLTWLCFGDFNEILSLNEKSGGLDRNAGAITEFRAVVRDCKLFYLGSEDTRLLGQTNSLAHV